MSRRLPSAELARFSIVGVCVTLSYALIFLGLRSVGVEALAANLIAYGLGIALQYVAQTRWTFRRALGNPAQAGRFVGTTVLGLVGSSLITAGIGPAVGWPDWVSAGLVMVLVPALNYILFKLWVYRLHAE